MRRATPDAKGRRLLSSLQYFALGALAKAIATVLTYPYQVVKSRMQASKHDPQYQSTWGAMTHMWKTEGWHAFFQGMGSKMTQTVLNSAFMFWAYENLVPIIYGALRMMVMGPAAATTVTPAVVAAAVTKA